MRDWEPGSELDAEIACRVVRERIGEYGVDDDRHRSIASDGVVRDLPPVSTDIAAAWTVVDYLRGRGYTVHVAEYPERVNGSGRPSSLSGSTRATCSIERAMLGHQVRVGDAHASTAPLTICRAAFRIARD